MKEEKLELIGICTIIVRDKNKRIISIERKKNVITDAGKAHVAKLLGGITTKYFSYIQIGTGTTPPTSSDTELESYYAEKAASVSFSSPSSVVFGTTFNFSEDVTITESGIFSGPKDQSPVMLCRQVFTGKAMEAGRYLEIVWTIGVA